jgi:uncharacterized surface protein with fasciclin (FAS1) repeats
MAPVTVHAVKKNMTKFLAAAVVATGFGAAALPAHAQNAVTLTATDSSLSQWAHIVQLAGLTQAGQTNTVTVFAITNKGFETVNQAYSNALKSPGRTGSPNFQRMQALVRTQAVFGLHPMSDFKFKTVTLTSVAGTPIVVDGSNPAKITIKTKYITGTVGDQPLSSSQAVIYPVTVVHVNQ